MLKGQLNRVLVALGSCCLVWGGDIRLPLGAQFPEFHVGTIATARSSGGRSGGGSFNRRPSRSSSSSNRSSSSDRRTYTPRATQRQPAPDYAPSYPQERQRSSGPVIVPVPIPQVPTQRESRDRDFDRSQTRSPATESQANTGGEFPWLLVILGGGVLALLVWYLIQMSRPKDVSAFAEGPKELTNDTVTVSKLQVALLATARTVQAELTQISESIDPSTQEGLSQLLQEAVLALLRAPDYWTHVQASSQTVRSRGEAQQIFSQLSIAERSKFSVESLVNVGGQKRRKSLPTGNEEEVAAYIVVTLLLGTADDKPLFGEIRTTQVLQDILEKLAAIPSDYLMVFELLWSPQAASDSLTYEELLTEYTDMVQL